MEFLSLHRNKRPRDQFRDMGSLRGWELRDRDRNELKPIEIVRRSLWVGKSACAAAASTRSIRSSLGTQCSNSFSLKPSSAWAIGEALLNAQINWFCTRDSVCSDCVAAIATPSPDLNHGNELGLRNKEYEDFIHPYMNGNRFHSSTLRIEVVFVLIHFSDGKLLSRSSMDEYVSEHGNPSWGWCIYQGSMYFAIKS